MTYNNKQVEVLSLDDQTAVIRDDEGIKCIGASDLKADEKKTSKASKANK